MFSSAFEEHFSAVHRYIARRIGSGRADDLAAETFATAFSRRQSFDPERGSVRGWFFGIATNVLRSQWRAEQRLLTLEARLEHNLRPPRTDPTAAEGTDPFELAPLVARALSMLTADQRDVLLLYAWADLTYEGISSAIDLPVGTVRSRLSRARATLRRQLDPAAQEPSMIPDPEDRGGHRDR